MSKLICSEEYVVKFWKVNNARGYWETVEESVFLAEGNSHGEAANHIVNKYGSNITIVSVIWEQ